MCLNRTPVLRREMPMFEWNMITMLVLKNEKQNDVGLYDEIGLHSFENKDTILSSVVNTNGRAYVIG